MCISGKGKRPGRKAFSARRSRQIESLPPENSSTGLAHWPATSRRMWMASASSQSRWERVCLVSVDMAVFFLAAGRFHGVVAEGTQGGKQAGAQRAEAVLQAAARRTHRGGVGRAGRVQVMRRAHGSALADVQSAFLAFRTFPP